MDLNWVIAVLLAAMASFISNLGVTLQKLHHLRSAAADPSGANSDDYSKGWMWRIGLGFVFFGSLADLAALKFGPQSLVAPLGSLTLVSNVIFAPLLLKETIGHWDVLATVLIVVGSSIAVLFGSHESVTFSTQQLFSFFRQWDFVLYALIIFGYGFTLYLFIQKIELIEKEDGVHSQRYLSYKALHRFAYPSLSGTVGAQSVLFAKMFVELLSNTVTYWKDVDTTEPVSSTNLRNGTDPTGNQTPGLSIHQPNENMFLHWQSYFVLFGMLGAIFAQIKYLNEGLKRFDASYSVPVFTSFWIILSVVSGMIFYREYAGMDAGQSMFFAFGVLVTVTGVITLGGREQSHFGHSQLQNEEDIDSEVGSATPPRSSSNGHQEVGQGGSLNANGDYVHANGKSNGNGHHNGNGHYNNHDLHDDDVHLDLDDEAFDDVSINEPSQTSSNGINSSSLPHVEVSRVSVSAPHSLAPSPNPRDLHSASSHHHLPPHHSSSHHHHSSHHHRTIHEEQEGTVVGGTKLMAVEASQKISQAFAKLRKKGLANTVASLTSSSDPSDSAQSSSTHPASASSSSNAAQRNHDHDEEDHESLTSANEDDRDPLILKQKQQQSSSNSTRKSPSPFVGTESRTSSSTTPSTVNLSRKASLTPTASSLYDPSESPRSVTTFTPNSAAAASPFSPSSSSSATLTAPTSTTRRRSDSSETRSS